MFATPKRYLIIMDGNAFNLNESNIIVGRIYKHAPPDFKTTKHLDLK
jgi:hypothetical protein